MFFETFSTNGIYTSMEGFVRNNLYRLQESVYLNDMVAASLQPLTPSQLTQFGNNLTSHNIQFKSQTVIGCLLQDGTVIMKNLQ